MGNKQYYQNKDHQKQCKHKQSLFCSVHMKVGAGSVSELLSGVLNWKHTNKHASIKKIISDISPHPWLLNQQMMRGLPNTVNRAGCGL